MVYSTFSLSQAYLRRPWSPAHIRWSTLSRNFSTRSWTGPATLSTPNSTRHCITRVVSPRTSRPRDTSQWAPSPTSSRTSNRTSPSRRQAPLTSTIKWCTKRERVRRTVAVQIIQYLPEVRRNSQTRRCKWVQFLNPCDNASKMRQRNDPIVFLTCLFFFPATQAVFPSFFAGDSSGVSIWCAPTFHVYVWVISSHPVSVFCQSAISEPLLKCSGERNLTW